MTEETSGIFDSSFSTKSVPLSSEIANFICIDFSPNATSFVSNEIFLAPCFSIVRWACFSISLKSVLGDLGIIFTIIAVMLAMIAFVYFLF